MYGEIFEYVKNYLTESGGQSATIISAKFPFRKRSEHIWRVYQWAKRLTKEGSFSGNIDRQALLTAALFHDIGYGVSSEGAKHAENGAKIFNKYAADHEVENAEFVEYLIRNHSRKDILHDKETPMELVLLMEADLLDETGALSIVWDCMGEGASDDQSFEKTCRHIENYSSKILDSNPMRTDTARRYWAQKQNLMREFIKQLKFDLAIEQK